MYALNKLVHEIYIKQACDFEMKFGRCRYVSLIVVDKRKVFKSCIDNPFLKIVIAYIVVIPSIYKLISYKYLSDVLTTLYFDLY